MTADIHIGKEIKKVLDDHGMTQATFARRMGTSPQNVQDIFRRKSTDTVQLMKIGQVLGFDFVALYEKGDLSLPAGGGKKVIVLTFEDGELIDIQRDMESKGETLDQRLARLEEGLKTLIEHQVRNSEE